MILNSEDTDVDVINNENAEGGINIRMERNRNIVKLGTRIVIIHISNKHATYLHWTFIHISKCVCQRCQVMDNYKECLYCQEIAPISDKEN